MGNMFSTGGPKGVSVLSPEQRGLLGPLAEFVKPLIGQVPSWLEPLEQTVLRVTQPEAQALSERMFREALYGPAMEVFERDVAPKLEGEFARFGGTLSSRRAQTLAQERTNVVRQAQSSLAGILPQVMSFPLQQTLSQIQGMGGLSTLRYTPYQQALQFALSPTRSVDRAPPGPGWGLLGSAIELLPSAVSGIGSLFSRAPAPSAAQGSSTTQRTGWWGGWWGRP